MQCNVPENIVGILYTPWEFCGALSYIHHLNSRGHFPPVTIFVGKFPGRDDFLIPEKRIAEMNLRSVHLNCDTSLDTAGLLIRMHEKFPEGVGAELLVSPIYLPLETADMFKTLTCHAMWHLGTTRPKVLAIDEGVGVHIQPSLKNKEVSHIGEPGLLNGVLLSALMRGHDGPWTWFTVERGASGRFLPRPNVLDSYAKFFAEVYWEVFSGGSCKKEHYENIKEVRPVLFMSQPLVGDEISNLSEYQGMISSAWAACKESGLEMIVKLHPRDDIKYIQNIGVPYIKDDAIAEAVMSILKPRAVVGAFSTSMVNAKLIYDIPSASLLKIDSSPIRRLMDKNEGARLFAHMFDEFVDFPTTQDEFVDWLQRLKN